MLRASLLFTTGWLAACGGKSLGGDSSGTTDVGSDADADADADTDADTDTDSDSDTDTDTSGQTRETGSDTGKVTLVGRLEQGGVVACPDPTRRQEAAFDMRNFPTTNSDVLRMHGAGTSVEDFNGDGLLDMIMVGSLESDYFLQRPDGSYGVNLPGTFPAGINLNTAFGSAAADYDGDGDVDLFVTRYGEPDVLLNNDGLGNFSDVTRVALPPLQPAPKGSGLVWMPHAGLSHRSSSAAFGDYDLDGDLDLLVGGHGFVIEDGRDPSTFPPAEQSFLYRNEGDGTFTDVSDLIPQDVHDGYTFVVAWIDVDQDGYDDMYLINDLGNSYQECRFLWNRTATGQGFVPDNNAHGLDVNVAGMGLAITDVNGDLLPDFLVPAWGRFRYLLSSPGGVVWVDFSEATLLRPSLDPTYNQTVAWGSEFADFNNDTLVDAAVVFGFIRTQVSPNRPRQPDGLWLQQPGGGFVDVAPEWGFNQIESMRGLAIGDLNNDGWMDIVKPALDGPHFLHVSRCGEESWLRVRLSNTGSANTFGVGAKVRAFLPDGRIHERRIHAGGTGYGSSSVMEAHFGLLDLEVLPRLEVHWPDGGLSVFTDVPTRQQVKVVR